MREVTENVHVGFGEQDGEHMPIYQCLCGQKFNTWDAVLSIYPEDPWICPNCGVKLFFRTDVKVMEVE
jgi:DNA-directed RNA polymerase subunit RPC12/RpoP